MLVGNLNSKSESTAQTLTMEKHDKIKAYYRRDSRFSPMTQFSGVKLQKVLWEVGGYVKNIITMVSVYQEIKYSCCCVKYRSDIKELLEGRITFQLKWNWWNCQNNSDYARREEWRRPSFEGRESWNNVERWSDDSGEIVTAGRVTIPPLIRWNRRDKMKHLWRHDSDQIERKALLFI